MKIERKLKQPRPQGGVANTALLERKRKAEELAARSGVPLQVAFSIVDGKTTLDTALKSMMVRDKAARLVEQHGLTPSLAGQVARGQIPLAKVLARHIRRSSEFWKARYSVFDALPEQTKPLGLLLFGQDWLVGRVGEVKKYDFSFDAGQGSTPLQKHDVKLLLADADWIGSLGACLSKDSQIQAKGLGSTTNLDERFHVDKEKFFEAAKSGASLRLIFRDGDVLSGRVIWFSRYEFCVQVGEAQQVVGFFHALWNWEETPAEPAGKREDKNAAKQNKAKQHPKKKGRH